MLEIGACMCEMVVVMVVMVMGLLIDDEACCVCGVWVADGVWRNMA
jgi:hypothetical protein